MRPFGCHLTILNTLDHLGKFDGKSEEGYLLGYSTNSKGFRVYNRVTRKVQDCLHVNFLENQENQKGKGPDWMFDLDLLTPSMNYIPVRKENYADSKEQGISCDDVEDMDDQQFIIHTAQPMPPEERTAAKEVKLSSEDQALHDELVSLMHQESLAKAHNDDQRIAFEEEKRRISIAKGKEHVDSTFTLSTANTPPQSTGNTPKPFDDEQQAFGRTQEVSSQALADESWVEAMQEELLQFKLQEPASTPIEAHKSLGKDEEGEDVDVHLYRSMIGCLMYLTASRPDIMFAVCLCARFQVTNPKGFLTLHSVKRIYRDPHQRCQYLGRRLVSWQCKKQTIVAISSTEAEYVAAASCCAQADLLFDDENGVDCFPKQVICGTAQNIGYETYSTVHFLNDPRITPLTPSMLEVVSALAAEEEQSTSPHSRAASSARVAQSTHSQSAAHSQRTASVQGTASFQGTATSQGTAEIQRTADFQGTAEPHDAASIPKSPNDYTPTDASQTSGGDEGLLDIYALNREVRRLKKQTLSQAKQILKLKAKLKKLSKFVQPVVKHHALWVENQNLKKQKKRRKKHKKKVSSVKLGRNKDEGTLSEEHNVQEEDTTHPFFDDIADQDAAVTPDLERKSDGTEEVNIEEKEVSNVKSGETEELDLETTQSTARQGTITPRTLNFEDEAGPSSPLRPIQVMDSEEQHNAAEVLVAISRPRGLSIPGPIQSQPQQPTQGTVPKDKGKGILVEEPKKKKLLFNKSEP
ncbi:putative ribonuclease H-like domain-containing protein [Tanacetum coccineum]